MIKPPSFNLDDDIFQEDPEGIEQLKNLENKIKIYKQYEEQIKEQRILTRQCWWFVFDEDEPYVMLSTPEYVDLYGYLEKRQKNKSLTVAPELYKKVFDIVCFFHDTLKYAILDIKLDAFVIEPIRDLDSAPVGSAKTCRVLLLDEDKAMPLNSKEEVVPRPAYEGLGSFQIRDPKISEFDKTVPYYLLNVTEEALRRQDLADMFKFFDYLHQLEDYTFTNFPYFTEEMLARLTGGGKARHSLKTFQKSEPYTKKISRQIPSYIRIKCGQKDVPSDKKEVTSGTNEIYTAMFEGEKTFFKRVWRSKDSSAKPNAFCT